MIALLKKEGYREAPLEVTCTELPQQWRRPRGSQINPGSVGDLDWRSVREGGPSEALSSKLYDARKSKRSMTDMQQDLHTLGVDLGHLEDSPFAKHLRSLQVLGTDSMFGIVPEGSGISYQHPVSPHGFKTYISPNIVQCGTDAPKCVLPSWPVLFTSSNTYQLRTEILSATETSLLQDSRQQAKSTTWKAARTNRLTASSFGTVVTRESWTNVGLRNLTEERDLSRFSPEKKRELLCERNIAEQLGEGGPRPSLAKYDLRIRGRFKRLRRKHERRRKLRALHGSTEQAAPTSALFLAVPEPFDLGVRLWLARFGEVKRSGVLRVVGSDLAHQAPCVPLFMSQSAPYEEEPLLMRGHSQVVGVAWLAVCSAQSQGLMEQPLFIRNRVKPNCLTPLSHAQLNGHR
ncbi:hypothetical protein HPB47_010871 [Ixodes persulcatus]|uniref:Uncharacterized protein n=1 Tax=Ixodes persulcatus TaxID=34615 RepID=A0AC60NXW9_IXOPE|nr:hypothetical protein HPB47_010871 [Ixodes persulcatus]